MNIHEFDASIVINHFQLKEELGCDSIYICDDKLFITGDLTLEEATAGLAAHKPLPMPEPTVADKLAKVGLSVADLKTALGL
jgi:hypothetical protein